MFLSDKLIRFDFFGKVFFVKDIVFFFIYLGLYYYGELFDLVGYIF